MLQRISLNYPHWIRIHLISSIYFSPSHKKCAKNRIFDVVSYTLPFFLACYCCRSKNEVSSRLLSYNIVAAMSRRRTYKHIHASRNVNFPSEKNRTRQLRAMLFSSIEVRQKHQRRRWKFFYPITFFLSEWEMKVKIFSFHTHVGFIFALKI